ncbi:Mitochondrial ribosomal protein L11 [Hibiscus syriacus]|uniref:protein-serine/threonine phosphatase n=1 Tax=Hibiscus syriacus TaxID=106335 RepID=A0A6A3C7N6_HIBSY|nr:Mitochondrial ribosomal protein L11 [Hibiscus syriacus]
MALATDVPPASGGFKGGFNSMEDENEDTLRSLSQTNAAKPPRSLSAMRHCTSSAWLIERESVMGAGGLKSPPSREDSGFLSVFRSGSYFPYLGTFYGVFDGHGGLDAVSFTRKNILNFIVEDKNFGTCTKKATMTVANTGDSRAVLGKRGRAIELSKDHKPNCTLERLRIKKLGGVIYDGYLNGQFSVARALGD